jgi:restriction endonuclease S subunit
MLRPYTKFWTLKTRPSRYLVRTGDIVYSRRGDVERRALIRAEEDGWLCGTGCLRVRFGNGEIDPLYASYYLDHPKVREWIVRHAIGATMPNLNTSILSALPFVVPPPSEQKAIAHILGTLDDKIELNQQMNGTLEAIWGNAADITSNKFEFYQGDILFGKLRSYFHKVGVAAIDGICSTDILVVIPKSPEWFSLVLSYVSSTEFIDYTDATSTGTRMPRTNWQDMSKYEIVIPPIELAKTFNQQVLTMVEKIQVNIFESRTVSNIRDALLPKLLSGEIRVKEAEKVVQEVS